MIVQANVGRMFGTGATTFDRAPAGSRMISQVTGMTANNVWGIPATGKPLNYSCFMLPLHDGLGLAVSGLRGIGQILSSLHATAVGVVSALNNIRGSGTLTRGNLAGGRNQNCTIYGSGSIVANHATAKAALGCTVSIGARPSAFDITQAVWNAMKADYSLAGSMGKAVADAGSAGNPWSADAATNDTAGTMGRVLNNVLDEALGKWSLDLNANTLTLYRQDGVTVLKTFSLTSVEAANKTYTERV